MCHRSRCKQYFIQLVLLFSFKFQLAEYIVSLGLKRLSDIYDPSREIKKKNGLQNAAGNFDLTVKWILNESHVPRSRLYFFLKKTIINKKVRREGELRDQAKRHGDIKFRLEIKENQILKYYTPSNKYISIRLK